MCVCVGEREVEERYGKGPSYTKRTVHSSLRIKGTKVIHVSTPVVVRANDTYSLAAPPTSASSASATFAQTSTHPIAWEKRKRPRTKKRKTLYEAKQR